MRGKRAVLLVGSCALAIAAITAFATTRDSAHATTEPIHTSSLSPTIDQARYRFTISETSSAIDPLTSIPELEARVASPTATAFDIADLANLYLRRATTAGDPADFARAEQMAKRSLAVLPSPSSAPLTLAHVATARHEFRTAIQLARDYLAKTNSASAYTILTTSYLALGELMSAAESADMQVTEKPSSGAYLMRALVFAAQGRDAEAAYDFARAVAVEDFGDIKEATRLRTLWGRFLLRRGDTAGASLLLTEALRISPEDPLALAQRGELALRTGHARDARELFERAFTASRQVRYLIDLARAQALSNDAPAATSTRAQVEKLVRTELAAERPSEDARSPSFVSRGGTGHALDLVEILVDRATPADLEEAITLGTAEVARRPSAEVRFQLARAYHRAARHREGLVQIRAALATGARDARIYELAARLEAAMGNAPRAEMYRHEAALLDPANSGWRSLGMEVAR